MKNKVLKKKYLIIIFVILIVASVLYLTSTDETILLYLKSCYDFSEIKYDKFLEKIDLSCKANEDCIYVDLYRGCGKECINKNSDIEGYLSFVRVINEISNTKDCPIGTSSCVATHGCQCLNNKCESLRGGE